MRITKKCCELVAVHYSFNEIFKGDIELVYNVGKKEGEGR